MTDRDHDEPSSQACPSTPTIETILHGKTRDIDGLPVSRVLPSMARRLVGPFCFFDHLGPTQLAAGKAIDVRPHPHIGLSTVSYVLEGEVLHKDSLGSVQRIGPGAINWMTSGRGIVHSERTPDDMRGGGAKLHMIQLWVALPRAHEETDPGFWHHPEATLPEVRVGEARIRILAGSAYGATSPVHTLSPLFYCEVFLPAGASLPLPEEHTERAAYVLDGDAGCGAEKLEPRHMVVFQPQSGLRPSLGPAPGSSSSALVPRADGLEQRFTRGTSPTIRANRDTRLLLLGGEPHPEPRYMEWNFVSSSKERIEQAKADWRERRFPVVPGDDLDFIPLL